MFGAAMHRQTRMSIAAEKNKRIRFIVAQQHAVTWLLVRSDIVVLGAAALPSGVGDGHVDLRDQRYQRFRFTRRKAKVEVATEPLFQIFGFANIDDVLPASYIRYTPGWLVTVFRKACVKNITHWLADSALHRPWRIAVGQLDIAMNV